ncbi:unnamed protein product [Cylicocyclus nassatus]|uniref:Tyrosine-protein kinase n=1 Tax=Cylicocyclus nassatus TaxID=53992 RepID=A0AA36GGG5_CYLNA|nr:unnamed protein product [Cylicocyclus nassatus]
MDVERTQSSHKIAKATGQLLSKPKIIILPTIKLLVEKLKPDAKTPKTEKKATVKSTNKTAVEKPSIKTCVPHQVKATPAKEKKKSSKAEAVSQAEKKTNIEIINMLRRRRSRIRKAKSMATTTTTTTEGTTVQDSTEEHSRESTESTIEPIAHSVGSKKDGEEIKLRRCDSVRGICRSRTFAKVAVSKQCEGDLEDQVYYHGFRPRKDVAGLLKEPGDFIVRATDSRHKPEIVISVLSDKGRMFNLTVKNEGDKWQLGVLRKRGRAVPRFSKIAELVDYYSVHRLPGRAKLRRGIPRPSWLIKHENVNFDRTKDLIGTGNFCHVYKGTYMRTAEEKYVVAIKMSHEGHGSEKEFEETKTARDSMLAEAHMMSYYVHTNIVELYGVACDHPPVLIVMEFCPGGNLEQHLLTQKDRIEVGERVVYALEACRGMVFLHKKSCIHRDLAARNCLISSKGQIKISDFGLSKLADELEKMDDAVNEPAPQIPLRWMAPESLRRPMKFSKKSDVWSFAVLLYEIFNQGEKPWKTEPAKKIATMIRRCQMPTFPKQAPEDIAKIATQIWVADPVARPAMKEVCRSLAQVCKKCKPPPPEKFTLNSLEGVERPRKVVGQASMEESGDIDTEADTRSGDESLCTRTSRPVRRQRSNPSRLVSSQR